MRRNVADRLDDDKIRDGIAAQFSRKINRSHASNGTVNTKLPGKQFAQYAVMLGLAVFTPVTFFLWVAGFGYIARGTLIGVMFSLSKQKLHLRIKPQTSLLIFPPVIIPTISQRLFYCFRLERGF